MRGCDTKERLMETALAMISKQSYGTVSVDDICTQANVRKGSFYHFFPSKCDLAVASLEWNWQQTKAQMDVIFSTQTPPLKRLMDYCDYMVRKQEEMMKKTGRVCGCPNMGVGSEQAGQEEKLKDAAISAINRHKKYFESAIRDATEEGSVRVKGVKGKADEMFSYYLGALTQARITNSIEPLKTVKPVFMHLLGAKELKKEKAKG